MPFVYAWHLISQLEKFSGDIMTMKSLISFFIITGTKKVLCLRRGHERIPDNLYELAIGDEYAIAVCVEDVANFNQNYPSLADNYGNTGKSHSFIPVDIGSLTKGGFDSASVFVLTGSNLEWLTLQTTRLLFPIFFRGDSAASHTV